MYNSSVLAVEKVDLKQTFEFWDLRAVFSGAGPSMVHPKSPGRRVQDLHDFWSVVHAVSPRHGNWRAKEGEDPGAPQAAEVSAALPEVGGGG